MFRKLRPLDGKISSAFGLKNKKSQQSFKSTQSRHSAQEENQQMIPDGTHNQEQPVSPKHLDTTPPSKDTIGRRLQPDISREGQNDASAGSLASRYHRAMKEDVQSALNLAKEIGEETPLKTAGKGSSTSSSESDFDWNETDESELDESERQERKQRKLRQAQELEQSIHHAKRLRRLYLFLMKFSTPVRTTIIGVLGSGIAITPAILVWLKFTQLSTREHVLAWSLWLSISFATSCATSIIVDILPAIAIKLFELLYGAKPEKLKTQIELWMNVRYWTKVALGLTCYWVVLSLILSRMFRFYKDPHLAYFDWVMKVTAGLFTAGVVLLFEKILLQVIQLNFHRTSLKDRLEENERALWALDRLAAAKGVSHSPKKRNSKFLTSLTHHRTKSGRQTPGNKDSTIVDVPSTPKTPNMDSSADKRTAETSTSGGISSTQHKRNKSSNLLTVTDHLTSAINSALKHGTKGARGGMISSTHSAKKLAKKLFEGLDEDRGGVITRNEFEPYFKTASDAAMAFKLFDKDGNGDIDRKEMRNAVVRIYRERMSLAIGLKDMSSAVAKLDAVLISIASMLTIFIWLFIFNSKGTSSQLVPMATIILGFSFIFGNAAKNLFESMLFIFSIHPYDVGDLVAIDDVHMFVTEFGLFSTTFQRVDGQVVVAPNSLLISKKHILNIRRSGPMWETTEVMVGFDTPLEVLHEFRARLRQYVMDNPREWKGGLDVNIEFINNQNLIQLIIAMEHKSNWQDWGARWDRRTLLMKEMKRIMDSLNITYKLPTQPISLLPQKPGPRQRSSRREDTPVQSQHPPSAVPSRASSTNATPTRTNNPSHAFQSGHPFTSFRFPATL
ncbi:uncharacterized protein PGTG_20692 [Puccinia graminis f. sp. tritici CRL 75-36-700-3]|uniref:EF-hand domain-containing protein n=1 Tax=Puccinia graminis f. sp. tritici (strain CRL 75-36-700-3 / race SCCL) TaxID=418459 RepID=H6QPE7_PUCGT|nr:uncharacterized protein PGTG_20692 [Puccinia graminis f. sp. tritici CRL 75-36-700-3]EHS63598.1 hypothetical protein PGTG_20692 [Puccinia graminis f. sp. tritici CRL 75-36-700-3]